MIKKVATRLPNDPYQRHRGPPLRLRSGQALAKNARMGQPRFIVGKEEPSGGRVGQPPLHGHGLGRFLRLWAKFDDCCESRLRRRPQLFPKVLWYVKLNHVCHDNLLDPGESGCAGLRQIVRSPSSVATSVDATFIAAMIRTSCSVKPRVLIFHHIRPSSLMRSRMRSVSVGIKEHTPPMQIVCQSGMSISCWVLGHSPELAQRCRDLSRATATMWAQFCERSGGERLSKDRGGWPSRPPTRPHRGCPILRGFCGIPRANPLLRPGHFTFSSQIRRDRIPLT